MELFVIRGSEQALPLLLRGLQILEYRGYDSAGVGLLRPEAPLFQQMRAVGEVQRLIDADEVRRAMPATCGIGHTRWASHGRPSVENAHPHQDCRGTVVLVHNGDIEDHLLWRTRLKTRGHTFRSETDTEVIAHLLEEARASGLDPVAAIRAALKDLRGTYALGIMFVDIPGTIYLTKLSGSLIIGKTSHGMFAVPMPRLCCRTRVRSYVFMITMWRCPDAGRI